MKPTPRKKDLRRGGIHVAPALRGTAFFGKPWHDGWRALNKHKLINALAAVAETMASESWTDPRQIVIALAKRISPFENVRPTEYPLTAVITRNDSHVNPTHSQVDWSFIFDYFKLPAP